MLFKLDDVMDAVCNEIKDNDYVILASKVEKKSIRKGCPYDSRILNKNIC